MDPHKLLNVPKDFTLEQLREQYKKIALKVHPDKGGTAELFELVTNAYKKLLQQQERKIEKDFMELKREFKKFDTENQNNGISPDLVEHLSRTHIRSGERERERESPSHQSQSRQQQHQQTSRQQMQQQQQQQQQQQLSQQSSRTSVEATDVFNRVFEENRMDDVNSAGYGSVMAKSGAGREDINVPNTMRSFKINKFNKTFENQPISTSAAVQVYKQPEPTLMAKRLAFSELGVASIDDFSGTNDSMKRLNYTDYLKAHSTSRLVDPRTVRNRQEFKTVGELEAHRGNTHMSEEEQQEYAEYQDRLKEAEVRRINNLQQQDRAYEGHFNNVNQRMLEQMRR